MTAIRIILMAAALCGSNMAAAQTQKVNGWLILDLYWEGRCVMQKAAGLTSFQFEPAHGNERTHVSIFDHNTSFVSGPVGMSLRVPGPGGAGPYNAFSADARALNARTLTVGVYDGEAVVPWLAKATEFRLNMGDYQFSFPLSGQQEALVALYECMRKVPARQKAFEEYAEDQGW